MSTKKIVVIILLSELELLVVGLIKAVTTSSDIPNFAVNYMLGYSLPILGAGLFLFLACLYIFRERRVVSIQPKLNRRASQNGTPVRA